MRYAYLGIGSVLAILFIVQSLRGKKYEPIVINLDQNIFPVSELYIVGFAWSSSGPLKLKGKRAETLKAQAAVLYDAQYAEYYANIAWAQTLTLVHLFLAVTFLVAGTLYDMAMLMLVTGIFMSVVVAAYGMENMKDTLTKRTEECESQLPEVVSTMAILVNSGMVLRDVWNMVACNGEGAFYELMRKAADHMRSGYSDAGAILWFGKASNSTEIRKFTSALLQSMEKGGAELSDFLARQSSELWNMRRQHMLQSGEKAASKLLLPIMLMFIGIIIIVMTAAFAGPLF